ncbi:MAG: GTP-binding protein [Anaerolineales bacterium]|nr:MAG: GTP-binding protein [Anaerolineales bacterium]
MTITSLLNTKQKEIWQSERDLLLQLMGNLEGWELADGERKHLLEALDQLNELFLLVIVGEFNSGKSALINALLGETYLKEGVTPTTDRIHIVKYGDRSTPEMVGEDIRILRFPADMLRQIHIVDTPGTNAVMRHHEAIVREFVPRSDMVIFVTSADRPFTQSEREFLENIREWGKKVVVVINKIDILQDEGAIEEVRQFVQNQVQHLLGFDPTLFALSAHKARTPSGEIESDLVTEFIRFQGYLEQTLSEQGIIKLKLLNPLGVASKVTAKYLQLAQERLEILSADAEIMTKVEHQLALFESDTDEEFGRHLDRMDKDLLQMRLRGEEFIDNNLRLLKIPQLLRSKEMQSAFEREVVSDTPARMDGNIHEIIDWLVERELRQWRMMAEELGRRKQTETLQDAAREAAGGFAYNRRQLLDTLGHQADEVVRSYNRTVEAERLMTAVKESIALVGLVEVGAISLGLILKAVLTTAAADATGILAAGLLGMLGLAIIPYRREQAKRELRKKMSELQGTMRKVLTDSFKRELGLAVNRLNEALAPYRRFVRSEEEQLKLTQSELHQIAKDIEAIRFEVDRD